MKSKTRSKISDDSFLGFESLSISQLNCLASDIRSDILSVCLANGGHLSSNLGAVELTIECLKSFNPLKDDILFDVGHQTYAYKILTGRNLKDIRMIDGVSPFLLKEESKYDKYSSGHAGDALPIAVGIAKSKANRKDDSFTVCVTGDSSILNGLSFESLNYLAEDKIKRLIIILNDNGMSISQNVGVIKKQFVKMRNSKFYFTASSFLNRKLSKTRVSRSLLFFLRKIKNGIRRLVIPNNIFESMSLKYMGPFDGNDLTSLDIAFNKAKLASLNGPVILHLFTKKGYGFYPAMNDDEGEYHGVNAQFDSPAKEKKESLLDIKEEFLLSSMEKDKKMFVITPAMLVGSKLSNLKEKYPERVIDVGIAEENAICVGSGLALDDSHPVIDIYSTFLQRGYDEIFADISRNKISSLFFIDRAGLTGNDGSSHQGIYDVSFLKTIPDCKVYMPFDKKTFKHILKRDFFSNDYSTFIRLSKDEIIREDYPAEYFDDYLIFKEGKDNLLIVIGQEGFKLAKRYFKSDFKIIALLNLLPDKKQLNNMNLLDFKRIFVYDAYSTKLGSVEHISSYLFENKYRGEFNYYSFPVSFIPHGDVSDLYLKYELDNLSVYKKIEEKLKKDRD
ncbi:MAG: 1-deoxy-D-xylulose-5-phosphate synthase [Bacilli bacterium]|nr:1-deoxy-D-xylulose-5-phosphate synthase [Bacilli bacterium]